MELLCIVDAARKFGVSSKTLRYYEQAGLLSPARFAGNKFRYYDAAAVERIGQILILRKMQISVKDIMRIYESDDMSAVVDVFARRIKEIDEQIGALSELRRITADFLQAMTRHGITKISALPLLYEEMDRHLAAMEIKTKVSYEELETLSAKSAKEPDMRIIDLPSMRVLTSLDKNDESSAEGFWEWLQMSEIPPRQPGAHRQFEYQDDRGRPVAMLEIPGDYTNETRFADRIFAGGLFAAASVYADEDLGAFCRAMVRSLDVSPLYEMDYTHGGRQRHETLVETLLSPDGMRELLDIFIPVKRRLPDAGHLGEAALPETLEGMTPGEIERANPALWKYDAPLDKLKPISVYNDRFDEFIHYKILPGGEISYTPNVGSRYLSTDISVKLPFRVDIEFMTDNHFLILYHDGSQYFVNGGYHTDPAKARGAMEFMQPVYKDWRRMEGLGRIALNEYNRVSWIVGEKHFALIINGEVRYCGVNFPYMREDFGLLPAYPVMIGSNGNTLYIKSISISQLKYTPKSKIKGSLNMVTKRSNNILPNIRVICRGDRGENHEFCGAAAYVMECIGETAIGEFTEDKNERLWFFEGLTADVLAQVYSYAGYQGWARSEYLFSKEFVVDLFGKCGYASTFVTPEEFNSNREMYLNAVAAYIDKGVPVIIREYPHGDCKSVCGYEDYGKTLLYLHGSNTNEINKMAVEGDMNYSFVFVGEKKRDVDIARVYRKMICDLPEIFAQRSDKYCFGADAFAAWAEEIEQNRFKPDTVYVCDMATNSGCSAHVFEKVVELNPDMAWIMEIKPLYNKTGKIWDEIEKLGLGFGITQAALDDGEKRSQFGKLVREAERLTREAADIIKSHVK